MTSCASAGSGPDTGAEEAVVRRLEPLPVARIDIGPDEEGWLSDSGRLLLLETSAGWVLRTLSPDGLVEEVPVDEVSILSVHRVLDRTADTGQAAGTPTVIIDQTEYVRTADGWTSGACYWCANDFPDLPTVSAAEGEREWSLVVSGRGRWTIVVDAGWDGERPVTAGALDGSSAAAVIGHTTSGDTLLASAPDVDSASGIWPVCEVDGEWELVGVDRSGVVLVRDDTTRQRSTARVPHCSSSGA